MIGTSHVVGAARLVRITAMTFALAILVGFVALQSFSSQYHVPQEALVMQTEGPSRQLVGAISLQEYAGRHCAEKPTLTDTILFERTDSSAVQVLTFDEAIAASSARQGWIRRYCS